MNKFIFANPTLCAGCDACVDACAEAHKTAGLQAQARISIVRNGDAATPITCRQCNNAPCAKICPVGALKMGDGTVELDESKCIGCKLCAVVCPFGVISLSGSGSDAGMVAVKCDLCAFAEKGPACVQACATKALFVMDGKAIRKAGNAKRKAAVSGLPPFLGDVNE